MKNELNWTEKNREKQAFQLFEHHFGENDTLIPCIT
jgi:predicted HNH restriction endonuclease